MRFVDTNVLLYAATGAGVERAKAEIATDIMSGSDLVFSVQVLQEFFVQATRATRPDRVTAERAQEVVMSLLRFPTAVITPQLMMGAIATSQRYQISYWDAAIIEAARSLRCDVVLSEDLREGQDYGGVRVENPFVAAS